MKRMGCKELKFNGELKFKQKRGTLTLTEPRLLVIFKWFK